MERGYRSLGCGLDIDVHTQVYTQAQTDLVHKVHYAQCDCEIKLFITRRLSFLFLEYNLVTYYIMSYYNVLEQFYTMIYIRIPKSQLT